MSRPINLRVILEPGDPKCVHHEDITSLRPWIGTCRLCGRKVEYFDLEDADNIYRQKGRSGQAARKRFLKERGKLAVV